MKLTMLKIIISLFCGVVGIIFIKNQYNEKSYKTAELDEEIAKEDVQFKIMLIIVDVFLGIIVAMIVLIFYYFIISFLSGFAEL